MLILCSFLLTVSALYSIRKYYNCTYMKCSVLCNYTYIKMPQADRTWGAAGGGTPPTPGGEGAKRPETVCCFITDRVQTDAILCDLYPIWCNPTDFTNRILLFQSAFLCRCAAQVCRAYPTLACTRPVRHTRRMTGTNRNLPLQPT